MRTLQSLNSLEGGIVALSVVLGGIVVLNMIGCMV